MLQHRLDRVRALLAASALAEHSSPALGVILLRSDQVETARRVREHLRRDGGCLLADDVGTGKTYVALAVTREWARPLVVIPASLRSTWAQAIHRADVECVLVTHEALSQGRVITEGFDGIVVDESHRFRPTSRRHAALAELAARAPVLMLSATPMQNRTRELAAQIALFVGEMAYALEPAQLTRWVVRSAKASELPLPRVRPPRWLAIDTDDGEVLRAILALPPPPRAADAGDGGVLLQLSLVRAWASSRAALVAAVRRRQRTLAAIDQCHQEGRQPTRRELRSWNGGDDVQLGFPSLLASTVADVERSAALTVAIDRERAALDALLRAIASVRDPDPIRVEALRARRRAHDGDSLIAFSESRSTVHMYGFGLRTEAGVGTLGGQGARIASGRLTRDELLARFAPRAQGTRVPAPHERITLLVTTDLLSEGVNLQDASVVVHLDLPWNPARLAQRLGRIRRPGGAAEVASYLMSPPAHAALLLRAEARLRAKLARAERTIGRSMDVLPSLDWPGFGSFAGIDASSASHAPLSAAEVRGEIAHLLAQWRSDDLDPGPCAEAAPIVSGVRAPRSGWIALLDDGRLVAALADDDGVGSPDEMPETILSALTLASGAPRHESDVERDMARRALDEWIARDWTHHSCGVDAADSPMRRRVRRALDEALRAAPRHRRARILECAAVIRHRIARPLPLGVERALDALLVERATRNDWIEAMCTVLGSAPILAGASAAPAPPRWRAMLLLGNEAGASLEGAADVPELAGDDRRPLV